MRPRSAYPEGYKLGADNQGWLMGLKNKVAGFSKHLDNLPPNIEEIYNTIKSILGGIIER